MAPDAAASGTGGLWSWVMLPRLRYERDDLEAVAEALHVLYERRREMPPITVTYGKDLPLRHFKAHFVFGPSERGNPL